MTVKVCCQIFGIISIIIFGLISIWGGICIGFNKNKMCGNANSAISMMCFGLVMFSIFCTLYFSVNWNDCITKTKNGYTLLINNNHNVTINNDDV